MEKSTERNGYMEKQVTIMEDAEDAGLKAVMGMICIFVLLALLFSLISWLTDDISSTFSIIRTRLT